MTKPHTDCPPCPSCKLPVAIPQLADHAGHGWDGRHRTTDPRDLWCPACGHTWREHDLDAVAKSWRAEAANAARLEAEVRT